MQKLNKFHFVSTPVRLTFTFIALGLTILLLAKAIIFRLSANQWELKIGTALLFLLALVIISWQQKDNKNSKRPGFTPLFPLGNYLNFKVTARRITVVTTLVAVALVLSFGTLYWNLPGGGMNIPIAGSLFFTIFIFAAFWNRKDRSTQEELSGT